MSLIKEVKFVNLFTFIYSPRPGTQAASMPDPVSHEEKTHWFAELLKEQEEIALQNCKQMLGRRQRVLVENREKRTGLLSGRTPGSLIVLFPGDDSLVGNFAQVEVTETNGWSLKGKEVAF